MRTWLGDFSKYLTSADAALGLLFKLAILIPAFVGFSVGIVAWLRQYPQISIIALLVALVLQVIVMVWLLWSKLVPSLQSAEQGNETQTPIAQTQSIEKSTASVDHQEYEQLQARISTLESEVENKAADIKQLTQENERLKEYENHWLLKLALEEARDEGLRFKERGFSDKEVGEWSVRIESILQEALPPFYAKSHDDELVKHTVSRNPEKRFNIDIDHHKVLDITLKNLDSYIEMMDSRKPPQLLSDFDGTKWVRGV